MKNLKKLVSVVLTLALLISSMVTGVIAVDYADVETTDANYEAIDILSGLNILKGDEVGNFNPDAEIKRSEVAAVIARALGQENAANGSTGYSAFADVSADHWAVGYINWAAQQGIVNGRDANTFDADASVKYQEVIKMIVAALGYEPLAQKRGGYPTGYMVIASSNGITSGISLSGDANAPRKIVAQAVYNALEVPLMDASIITASGDDEYAIYNGKNDNELRTILSHYLEIAKIKGQVVATTTGAISGKPIDIEKGDEEEVVIEISELVGYDTHKDNSDDAGEYFDGEFDAGEDPQLYCGGTGAEDLLGYYVIAYVGVDEDDDNRIYAITPDTKTSDILEIKDWYDSYKDNKDGTYEISYYVDGDTSDDAEEVDVKDDAVVIINGAKAGKLEDNVSELDKASDIVLMGSSKEDAYSYVFITKYQYAMVTEVDVEDEIIKVTEGSGIDLSDEELRYVITLDGEAIELGDLQENDVLSLVWKDDDATENFVKILVSRTTVEGVVTEKSTDDNGDTEFVIDGMTYKYRDGDDALTLGDEGTFYLTTDGRIYDYNATSVSKDFAFITRIDAATEFNTTTYYVEMLTADGVLADYTVASSVKVKDGTADAVTYKRSGTGSKQETVFGTYDGKTVSGGMIAVGEFDDRDDAIASIAKRFISYTLNSNSEISSINFAKAGKEDRASVLDSTTVNGSYKPSSDKIGSVVFDDNTKLFVTPITEVDGKYIIDEDDVEIASISSLDEDREAAYTGFGYSINTEGLAGAILLYNDDIAASGSKNALAVITGTTEGTNAAGEEATGYSMIQSGEAKTVYESEDIKTKDTYDGLSKGDIVYFTVDGAGDIVKITEVYDASEMKLVKTSDGEIGFVFGNVATVKSRYIGLADVLDTDDVDTVDYTYANEEGATYAVLDEAKASTKSYVSTLSGTGALKESGSKYTYYAVIRTNEDDEALDVIQIKQDTDDAELPEDGFKLTVGGGFTGVEGDDSSN